MHARLKPKPHRFSYNIFSLVIDVDRLNGAKLISPMFAVNSAGLVSFHEKDHGKRDGSSLRKHINELLEAGNLPAPGKILLWCSPRILGYTFNPLSVYFCHDENGHVYALVYQVHNTFGQSHSYVAAVDKNEQAAGSIRQSADKRFYVSPFLDMDLRYNFRINPPEEKLKIRILEHDQEGPILAASFFGHRKPLNGANLLLGICKTAGLTWKITAGIHFEAVKLWLKGISIRPRPAAPVPVSHVNGSRGSLASK